MISTSMNGCSQLCTHIKVFHSWCMLITPLQWSDKHLWQMSPPQSRCFLPPCHSPATAQGSPHLSPVEHLVTMTTDGYHTNTDATIGHRKVYSQVYTPHLTLVIIPHSWGSCRSSGQEEPLSSWSPHHIAPPEGYYTQEWGLRRVIIPNPSGCTNPQGGRRVCNSNTVALNAPVLIRWVYKMILNTQHISLACQVHNQPSLVLWLSQIVATMWRRVLPPLGCPRQKHCKWSKLGSGTAREQG